MIHPLTSPVPLPEANKRTLGHWKAVGGSGRSGGFPSRGSPGEGFWEKHAEDGLKLRHVGRIYLTYSDPISSNRIYLYVCVSIYQSIYLAIYPKYIFADVCEWLQMLIWE